MSELPDRFKPGDRVVAYGRHHAEVLSDRLAYNAYAVRTEPITVPGKKRRQRVTMTVSASNLVRDEVSR